MRDLATMSFASSTTHHHVLCSSGFIIHHPNAHIRHGCPLQIRSCTSKPVTPPRPVVILPGLGNNSSDYSALRSSLERTGVAVTIAEVSRPDWLRNAMGLIDRNYWAGMLSPRPVLDWYLERMKKAIIVAKESEGDDCKVSLIGHSAGGWLARVFMSEFGTDDIALLLSLGTPHLPPPKGVSGVVDQTRGLLDYVNRVCPGTHFAPDVKYVCVAGRYLKGDRLFPAQVPMVATTGIGTVVAAEEQGILTTSESRDLEKDIEPVTNDEKIKSRMTTIQARIVGQGYKQVCGQADVWGDGVVPEMSAHLEGATNVTLDGVYHSPVGARDPERPWYGSPGILDQWVHYLFG